MTSKTNLKITDIKTSCSNCSLSDLCLPHGMDAEDMDALDNVVKRQAPMQAGQHLYRAGDPSHALFAVRAGCLKTYCTTEDGEEQVVGFALPGELVGLDGLSSGHFESNSVALQTTSVCILPFNQLENLCATMPTFHRQMMRVMGNEVNADHELLTLLGKRSAQERLAALLLSLSRRFHSRQMSATEFNLPMSRQDIGNYLGLAIETVSRLFAQFQDENLISVNRRQIVINDLDGLTRMVTGCESGKSNSATLA